MFGRSAPTYDETGAWLFPHMARVLVAAADVRPGETVLDVATGTGQVLFATVEAIGPAGRVVGVDLTAEMLSRARNEIGSRGIANAEVHQMDAERLTFAEAAFDRVLCGFALFFFPDPDGALRGFHRVLRPGGTVGVTTFAASPAVAWLRELFASFGVPPDPLGNRPFNTPELLTAAFSEAGFESTQVRRQEHTAAYADEEAWWRGLWGGGNRARMEAMDEATLARFKVAAFEGLAAYRDPTAIKIPRPVLVTTARRPV